MRDLAELAWTQGISAPEVEDIRSGRKLVDLELQLALNSGKPARLASAIALGADMPLWAAVFSIDPAVCPGSSKGYAAHLAAQGDRELPDRSAS